MKSRAKFWTLARNILTLAFLGLGGSSAQASYSQVIFFGDSLSDTGNLYASQSNAFPVSPPYYNGAFSNGPLWTENFAGYLGLSATPMLAGGTNFAWAGATVIDYGRPMPTLPTQLGQYLSLAGSASPDALYVILGGANDITDASLNPATAALNISNAAYAVDAMVDTLYAAGARNILVGNLPDTGKTPRAIAGGPAAVAGATALSNLFNATLAALLSEDAATSPFLNLDLLDLHTLLDGVTANPAAYGFNNVSDPCKSGDASMLGLPGAVCATPDTYLYWDVFHPTAAAHELIAGAALRAVPEPGSVLLLLAGLAGLIGSRKSGWRINEKS